MTCRFRDFLYVHTRSSVHTLFVICHELQITVAKCYHLFLDDSAMLENIRISRGCTDCVQKHRAKLCSGDIVYICELLSRKPSACVRESLLSGPIVLNKTFCIPERVAQHSRHVPFRKSTESLTSLSERYSSILVFRGPRSTCLKCVTFFFKLRSWSPITTGCAVFFCKIFT